MSEDPPTGTRSGVLAWSPGPVALSALVFALVILVVAVIWLALLVQGQHARNSDRDAALAAARQIATDYSTYDYNHADAQFAHLAKDFTGPLKQKVQQDLQSVISLIKAGKGAAKGQVRDTAVAVQRGNQISVVAVVDESVSNTSIPKGTLRRYRFLLVMSKVQGHWLVSDLQQA